MAARMGAVRSGSMQNDVVVIQVINAERERRMAELQHRHELRAQLAVERPVRPSLARRIGRMLSPARIGAGQASADSVA
jgi:hypothetical protein